MFLLKFKFLLISGLW